VAAQVLSHRSFFFVAAQYSCAGLNEVDDDSLSNSEDDQSLEEDGSFPVLLDFVQADDFLKKNKTSRLTSLQKQLLYFRNKKK
jgi:hypothetical protein